MLAPAWAVAFVTSPKQGVIVTMPLCPLFIFVLWTMAAEVSAGCTDQPNEKITVKVCPIGYRVLNKTHCIQCDPGYALGVPNVCSYCSICSSCRSYHPFYEKVIEPCQPDKVQVCGCQEGFVRDPKGTGHCLKVIDVPQPTNATHSPEVNPTLDLTSAVPSKTTLAEVVTRNDLPSSTIYPFSAYWLDYSGGQISLSINGFCFIIIIGLIGYIVFDKKRAKRQPNQDVERREINRLENADIQQNQQNPIPNGRIEPGMEQEALLPAEGSEGSQQRNQSPSHSRTNSSASTGDTNAGSSNSSDILPQEIAQPCPPSSPSLSLPLSHGHSGRSLVPTASNAAGNFSTLDDTLQPEIAQPSSSSPSLPLPLSHGHSGRSLVPTASNAAGNFPTLDDTLQPEIAQPSSSSPSLPLPLSHGHSGRSLVPTASNAAGNFPTLDDTLQPEIAQPSSSSPSLSLPLSHGHSGRSLVPAASNAAGNFPTLDGSLIPSIRHVEVRNRLFSYKMYPNRPAGIALFFYDDQEREYKFDLQRISASQEKVGFDTSWKYVAISPKYVRDKIQEAIEYVKDNLACCFTVSFITHGSKEGPICTDGNVVANEILRECFVGVRHLVGIPIVFFMDICLGDKMNAGVRMRIVKANGGGGADESASNTPDHYSGKDDQIPEGSDIIMIFASQPGTESYRDVVEQPGEERSESWFFAALSEQLDKYADKDSLYTMIKRVTNLVGQNVGRKYEGRPRVLVNAHCKQLVTISYDSLRGV